MFICFIILSNVLRSSNMISRGTKKKAYLGLTLCGGNSWFLLATLIYASASLFEHCIYFEINWNSLHFILGIVVMDKWFIFFYRYFKTMEMRHTNILNHLLCMKFKITIIMLTEFWIWNANNFRRFCLFVFHSCHLLTVTRS